MECMLNRQIIVGSSEEGSSSDKMSTITVSIDSSSTSKVDWGIDIFFIINENDDNQLPPLLDINNPTCTFEMPIYGIFGLVTNIPIHNLLPNDIAFDLANTAGDYVENYQGSYSLAVYTYLCSPQNKTNSLNLEFQE